MTNLNPAGVFHPNRIKSDQRLGLVFGLVGVLLFAGTLPATRIAVASFDAGFLTFGRAFVASIAAGICLLSRRKKFPRNHMWSLIFAGLMLVYGFPGFMTLAMISVPASHGGVVLGILPLSTAIFAVILAGERPSLLFWLCGIIGAVLIVIFTLKHSHWVFQAGDLWLLIAALCASAGYVISGKLSHQMPGWEVICWCLVIFVPISATGMYAFWKPGYLVVPAPQLGAFAYVSLGSMFLGFFAWNAGLKLGGIARVGQLQLLQTFFTLGIAALLLDEKITLETFGFAIAVLVTVLAGQKTRVTK